MKDGRKWGRKKGALWVGEGGELPCFADAAASEMQSKPPPATLCGHKKILVSFRKYTEAVKTQEPTASGLKLVELELIMYILVQ